MQNPQQTTEVKKDEVSVPCQITKKEGRNFTLLDYKSVPTGSVSWMNRCWQKKASGNVSYRTHRSRDKHRLQCYIITSR